MSLIYQPRGRAGEYAKWALNVYNGCSHGCVYCFGPKVMRRERADFHQVISPRMDDDDFIKQVGLDARRLKDQIGNERVLLCFVSDPYQPLEGFHKRTRHAISVLHNNDIAVQILTKAGELPLRDLEDGLFEKSDAFAVTLTCLDEWEKWEPGAGSPISRMHLLERFHAAGIPTWVSLEPIVNPYDVLTIIKLTHKYVDHYKVGPMNYVNSLPEELREEVNYKPAQVGLMVETVLQTLHKSYYLKNDLREQMADGTYIA